MTVDELDALAERFEGQRTHLRGVAYRMLGSLPEAEDAVQEAWLRLSRSDVRSIENLGGWLTTVVGRICLDLLRSRTSRREDFWETHLPDPVITDLEGAPDPGDEALLADSVGLAMLVVLDALSPAERLAFVLHDMFAVPFDDIAPIVDRTPNTTAQLASRARRRVQDAATPDVDLARQREVVDAFLAAARDGDFDALVAVLDPDVVLRTDAGSGAQLSRLIRGAAKVAGQALRFARPSRDVRPALVNGVVGIVVAPEGRPMSVMAFTVRNSRIVEIHSLVDAARLARLVP